MPTNYVRRVQKRRSGRPCPESRYGAEVEPVPVLPDVLSPVTVGPLTLRNRVVKSATYEGLSHRGRVTKDLVDFHRAYAAGGVGMTTVAYCAVAPDGRTSPDQILWTDEAMPGLRVLTDAVHAEGAAISAQLGHAGPVADPRGNRLPALSPSTRFPNIAGRISRKATPKDLDRITRAHAAAATRAIEAGFDAVEVHLGHSYLASAFLSPKINHRTDEYGGSLLNRARFGRGILRAVRDVVGDRIAVITKLNLSDGVRGGITVDEAVQTAQWIEQDGTVDALEMTAGSSLLNPMYLFKGGAPVEEFVAVMQQPMKTVMRFAGRGFIREYPYRDAFLLDDARRVRAEVSLPMILLGGITDRASMDLAMSEGFELVAMGRALLREPDLVNRIAADASTPSLCIHCNRCMPTNFVGTHCPVIHDGSSRSATWGRPEGYAEAGAH
jgi:2,4-dienoyl-CoA reductase-like NADH-dependent reductase (Old Yellow Enzyme family)